MRYQLLGRSGLRVSEVCLGTMTFGEAWGWGSSTAESRRLFDAFADHGGNFVDSANIYTSGEAERLLGEIITPDRRDRIVLATKYSSALPGDDPNAAGNHRKNMIRSVDDSLKKLKTDRIDIYYVHTWDFTSRPDEVMRAFDDLVRQGKIIYPGISDAPAWVVARCNELADQRGWSPFVVNQIEYSLLERASDREILPMSRALDLGVVAWSPLAGGILTGKYTRPASGAEKRRLDVASYKPLTERNLAIAAHVDAIAHEIGCPSAAVALAWVASRGIIPIVGATRVEQLIANIRFLDVSLSVEHIERLEAASAVELGFPHDFLQAAKGFVYGGMFDRIQRHRDEGIGTNLAERSGQSGHEGTFSYTDVVVSRAQPSP